MKYLILGGGSVTTEFYLPALRLMGRLADATVVDPNTHTIELLSPLGDVALRNQDFVSFLKELNAPIKSELSCVIVALPNEFHVEAARLALGQGRHVLCEKPVALSASNCAELRRLAAAQQRLLLVSMVRRYLPSWTLAADMVVAKELGDVRAVKIRDCTRFLWRPKSFAFFSPQAGGVLADMGVHYLDYLDTLLGGLTPIAYSDDARGGTESSFDYQLSAGNVSVDMRLSRIHESDSFLEIRCERGDIRINKQNENEVIVTRPGSLSRRITADNPFDDLTWPKNLQGSFCQMLTDTERAIEGHPARIADAADAERTVSLIEWAYARRSVPAASRRALSSDRTKVLVTGGTGFIGGHLVERLSGLEAHIRVAARIPAKCANVARFPVELVPTNLLDMDSVRAAVAGARIVYHLAYGNDGRSPARITIDGTKNVVEAAIAAGAECVVILSTMYVFGFPKGSGSVDESFPYRPYGGEYGRSKAAMERWCLERSKSSLPTRIVILNPTCVFGPGGGAYTTLPVDLARQGQFCWIDDGRGTCNYTYVENLVDAIVVAAQVVKAHGNRFIITDGTASWREFFAPLIDPVTRDVPSYSKEELERLPRYGGPFRIWDLVAAATSSPELRTVAKRSRAIRSAFRSLKRCLPDSATDRRMLQLSQSGAPANVPPEWLGSLFNSERSIFSARKANEILQWRPKVDLAAAQAATLHWLVEDGRHPAPNAPPR